MKTWKRLFGSSWDLAIDLGTENTLIQARGRGAQTWNEPSILAYALQPDGNITPWTAGQSALRMEGRTSETVRTVRPLADGVIVHLQAAVDMLRIMLEARMPTHPGQVLISFPHAITPIEKMAFRDLAQHLHPERVLLVKEPLAAAVGSGLDILRSQGHMIVDLGKGIIEAVIMVQGEVVASSSLRLQGRCENERIQHHLKEHHGLLVGYATLEDLKRRLHEKQPDDRLDIKGLSLSTGLPQRLELHVQELLETLDPYVQAIVTCVIEALEQAPVELLGDIMDRGIRITGGGALSRHVLRGLEHRLPVKFLPVAEPLQAVALGNLSILADKTLQKRLCTTQLSAP
ncbi:rod shape-determining protein [Oligoflexus tunisiensis]|uniref:rod shape-determining protein n=1 Tax=Oligoflexus tunisiensis TaxID=708132 RepID=UPI000ABCCA9C|nr:rod shape-determining protein [Oligoflexus tunisiensis]